MLKSILSASSTSFDVDSFSKKYGIDSTDIWKLGESSRRGPRTDSGFSICIAENEDPATHFSELTNSLDQWEDALNELNTLNVQCQIDCGFTVGGTKNFTRTLRFPAEVLEKIVSLNVRLCVSGYPSSDGGEAR